MSKTISTAPDAFAIFYSYQVENTKVVSDPSEAITTKSPPIFTISDVLSIRTTKPKTGVGNWTIVFRQFVKTSDL